MNDVVELMRHTADSVIDAVAIAIRQTRREVSPNIPHIPGLNGLTPADLELYRIEARAAIRAYNDALAANGWVVIPPPSGKVNERDRKMG